MSRSLAILVALLSTAALAQEEDSRAMNERRDALRRAYLAAADAASESAILEQLRAMTLPAAGPAVPISDEFSPEDRRLVEEAIAALPPAVRATRIAGIVWTMVQNASYDPKADDIAVGPFALHPDAEPNFNRHFEAVHGIDPGFTAERILYHEFVHAWHEDEASVADEFLVLEYERKRRALRADAAFRNARAIRADVWKTLRELGPIEDPLGRIDADAVCRLLAANPDLADEWYAALQTISERAEANGIPSRFRGDLHAEPREYFAIVLETFRYDPAKAERWVELARDDDPTNDVLTGREVDWVLEHGNLWKP